jgi:hypothetical protein
MPPSWDDLAMLQARGRCAASKKIDTAPGMRGKLLDVDTQNIDQLLGEGITDSRKREFAAFDRVNSRPSRKLCYDAGGLGRNTLKGFGLLDLEPLAFSDNNKSL